MEAVLALSRPRSWKDCLIGIGLQANDKIETSTRVEDDDDLDLLDENIVRSLVNGIPTIDFSKRVNKLLIKDMEHTVVTKLLGRSIRFTTLYNKIYSLSRPTQPF